MMKVLAKMSQFVNKTFALWVVIFGIAGFVFPEIFKQIGPWIAPLLGVVMFGMGLTLSPSDFREIFRRPRDVFLGILAQFTIMPGGAFLLCYALDLPPDVAVGLMLLGCCPGGTASNVVTFLARGDVALSVTITSCTTLLAPVMTPALMYLFASQWLAIDPTAMFMSIVQIILLPIAAGVFVHKLLGARIDTAVAALPLVSVLAIVLIAAAVTAASRHAQRPRHALRLPRRQVVRHEPRQMQVHGLRGRHAELGPRRRPRLRSLRSQSDDRTPRRHRRPLAQRGRPDARHRVPELA